MKATTQINKLKVFQNRVIRRMFGPHRQEVRGGYSNIYI
jgi:hypothetical protein